MKRSMKLLMVASTALVGLAVNAQAADMIVPEVIEAPVYNAPEYHPAPASTGWYLRGDVGYSMNSFGGADYVTYGAGVGGTGVLNGDLDNSYSVGIGVGFKVNDYLRTDVTLDYFTSADFTGSTAGTCTGVGADGIAGTADDVAGVACTSSDAAAYSALTFMANAYVDLGTYGRFTPYVGVGLGGSHVSWDALNNTIGAGFTQSGTVTHGGESSLRFTYAAMVGTSIDVTCNTALDLGYKYQRTEGGKMFKYAEQTIAGVNYGTGPGVDDGFDSHQVKAGLRYKFGGNDCAPKMKHNPVHMPPVYK